MKVYLKPFYGKIFKDDGVFNTNNGDNPFYGFDEKLKRVGIEISTSETKMIDSTWDIYSDVPFFWEVNRWIRLLRNKNKSILFCFESPLINPFSHMPLFFNFFKSVYTWNDCLVNNKKIKKFFIPALNANQARKVFPFFKKKLIVVINSNISVPYLFLFLSPFKHELYLERLKAIDYFEKRIPQEFHLYGRGWNAPKKYSLKERIFSFKIYRSYKGPIPRDPSSKVKILSQYKFCLCFENCRANGYISEKIIDCLKAHVVPIYYGAPNIQDYIPKNCYLDYRDFVDNQSLLKCISSMSQDTYNQYIENGKRYLKNRFNKLWSEDAFMKVFLQALGL